MSSGVRASVVLPTADARDAALFIAVARLSPTIQIIAPQGHSLVQWPSEVAPVHLPAPKVAGQTSQLLRGLNRTIARFEPDLVHVHNEPWSLTNQRLIGGRWPLVAHGAENRFKDAPFPYRIRRMGTRRVLKGVAGYINWGQSGLRAFEEAGLPRATPRCVIAGAPPDPRVFRRVPPREPDGRLVIVFVGRLVQVKGVEVLLRAVGSSRRREMVDVFIVGEGPQEASLRQLAGVLGVNAVFTGALDRFDVHRQIARADVLVAPSKDTPRGTEQWGRAVVEAMMTGRSVLASSSGELPNLVGNPEWIFRQGDPSSLRKSLDLLLGHPQLVRERGDEAFRRSNSYTPEVLAQRLLAFWEQVLAERALSRRRASIPTDPSIRPGATKGTGHHEPRNMGGDY